MLRHLWFFSWLLVLMTGCRLQPGHPTFPSFRQNNPAECGPVCLQMIAAHYSKKYSLKELVKLVNPENKSAISLWDLSQAAGKIGFNEISIASDYRLLTEEVPLPCIAHWQNNHFIVVYRIRHDSVDVADPALGLRIYHKEEFCKSWLNANEAHTEGILMLLEPKK